MAEYIDRQAAADAIADYLSKTTYTSAISFLNTAALILARVPSADVQPVRYGHWVKAVMPITGAIELTCSECGVSYYTAFQRTWNYCSNCGARMDGAT